MGAAASYHLLLGLVVLIIFRLCSSSRPGGAKKKTSLFFPYNIFSVFEYLLVRPRATVSPIRPPDWYLQIGPEVEKIR